jgi:hypothetical protein
MKAWFGHGVWNTLENGLTRVADVAVTVILLRMLPTEVFSGLAFAMAAIAPLLVLFVAPSFMLYRYYGAWKAEGPAALARRLAILRAFGRGLGLLAMALSLVAALAFPSPLGHYDRFFAYLWAFSLLMGMHLAGGDREFLRLELRWRALNSITIAQKVLVLGGAAWVGYFAPSRLDWLALAGFGSMLMSAMLAQGQVRAILGMPAPRVRLAEARGELRRMMGDFSLWNHLTGIALNWSQSMDVYFLGFFQVPALALRLYSAALKIANLTLAIPNTAANFYSI